MTVTVRIAGIDDAEALATLLREQDRHYGADDPGAERTAAAVRKWLQADGALGRFAIAREAGAAAGFASFAIVHPGTDLSGLLFLKDLFVLPDRRSAGVGEKLMRFLALFCVENGIGRIDFPTDRDNQRAQGFYRRLGAASMEDAGYHRLTGDALRQLASGGA